MTEAALVHRAEPVEAEERSTGMTLFGTSNPDVIASEAADKARVLAQVVKANGLAKTFGRNPKPYVMLEGWTFLGSMFGVFASVEWSRPLLDEGGNVFGYEARAEARTLEGYVVGAAEAMCTIREKNWGDRDQYAVRSMAQTRAISKALRMPLSFVTVLAGYEGTPADEMPPEEDHGTVAARAVPVETPGPMPGATGAGEPSVDGGSGLPVAEGDPASQEQWVELIARTGSEQKAVTALNKANKTGYTKSQAMMSATYGELARALEQV